jgi:2-keto-3-deoxy-L-rhamnonate aldolase RhmA
MADQARFRAFREKIAQKKLVLGMTCSTMSPVVVEIIGHAGFDFVIVDTEVLSINPETVENMVRAAEVTGVIPLVKLKDNDPVIISDAMNSGAPVIKVPHACSAEDLKRAIDATYFHPRGTRGLCSVSRANKYAQGKMTDLIEWTNDQAMVIPIIEDREAVERIDELMAVPGIDVYDIGPVDLSHSYHLPPDKGFGNPEIAAALDKIVASADKHGKHVMTVPVFGGELTPELAKAKLFDKGVRSIFYRTDSVIMRMGTRDALRMRELCA